MADPNLHSLNFYLSGGAANANSALSIGGAKGNLLLSESVGAASPMGGVVIDKLAGNSAGEGTLFFDDSANTLAWSSPGDTFGDPVDVSSGTKFTLFSASGGYIQITVTFGSTPSADVTATVTVSQVMENLFHNINKTQSIEGHIDYRCFYLRSDETVETFYNSKIYIKTQPPGADSIEIGIDPNGVNDGSTPAATIANETTAPAGVTFSTPTSGSPIVVGDLSPGDEVAIWVKRTVPIGTLVSVAQDIGVIAVEVYF